MELQHVNVKLFLKDSERLELEPLIPIFHSFIQDKVFEERLLDIADYRHVHNGPGVVLIGLEGDYAVDNTDGRLGVRYNRKAEFDGSNAERLQQAARAALNACQRLEAEASLGGNLRFNGQDVEVFINDRLLAPNHEATRAAVEPEFKQFFDQLFRGAEYSMAFDSDPRRLFSVSAKTATALSVADLLNNLRS